MCIIFYNFSLLHPTPCERQQIKIVLLLYCLFLNKPKTTNSNNTVFEKKDLGRQNFRWWFYVYLYSVYCRDVLSRV